MKDIKIAAILLVTALLLFAACGKEKEDTGTTANTRYTLTALPNKAEWGIVTGSGSYLDGTSVTIEAVANTGYYFSKWSDGAVSNPRKLTVNQDMTLYALFSDTENDPNPINPADTTVTPTPDPDPEPVPDPDPEPEPDPIPDPTPDPDPLPDPPQPAPDGYVDLGLPSGLLWATCNLGATSPEEYGSYYAWAETATKSSYGWNIYIYCHNRDSHQLTKYCTKSSYGYYGFTDGLTTLLATDDAATQVLGDDARTPTKEEWEELLANTTPNWTALNGVNGIEFTATNGNTLFVPAAGVLYTSSPFAAGTYGCYMTATLDETTPSVAWNFDFGASNHVVAHNILRSAGFSVRAVRNAE